MQHQKDVSPTAIEENKMAKKKAKNLSKAYLKKARKMEGGSNAGKYSLKDTYAGPAGGAPKQTFPLSKNGKPSKQRVDSAFKLAHNAPNPAGIKKKARAYAKRHGIAIG